MNRRIAVVDDDRNIRHLIESYLQHAGFDTVGLATAEEAWQLWQNDPPSLFVLDVMLPGMDGFELCRQIRQEDEIPIIIVSARDEEIDRVLGIELGSDDYLTKPFSPVELVARVKRLLYRLDVSQQGRGGVAAKGESGSIELKFAADQRSVQVGDKTVELTEKEYLFLKFLWANKNRPCSREEILNYVWGDGLHANDRMVDTVVKRLRKKLTGMSVESVWGYGYRLRIEGHPGEA